MVRPVSPGLVISYRTCCKVMHSNTLQRASSQRKVCRLGARTSVSLQQLLRDQQQSFGPDEIKVLLTAFEEALRELRLVDRTDPATQLVAKRIIELAQQGERDPIRLREGAVKGI